MPRALNRDMLEAAGLDILQTAGIELDNRPGLEGTDLANALRAADGAVLRSGTRPTADLLNDPGKLRYVVRAGVGVDNIDVPVATRRGVIVMNTPSGNTVSAAERVIGPIAVGRNKWLQIGGDGGLKTASVRQGVCASATRYRLNPRAYLRDVLDHLAARSAGEDVADLLPDVCARTLVEAPHRAGGR